MNRRFRRPYCKRPWLGAGIDGGVAIAFLLLGSLGIATPWTYWFALLFGGLTIFFTLVGVLNPCTEFLITKYGIVRSGRFYGGRIRYANISSAEILPEPDAANYRGLVLHSRDGQSVTIDSRFLDPDRDSIIELVRRHLAVYQVPVKDRFSI